MMDARKPETARSAVLIAVQWGLYISLAAPLLVWKRSLIPHLTGKVIAFQLLTEFLCLLVLIGVFTGKPKKRNAGTDVLGITSTAFACFIAFCCLSALFGADLIRSFWGIVERQDGLILLIHFLLWTIILTFTVRRHRRPNQLLLKYFLFSFCISVVVALSILYESYEARAVGDGFVFWRMLASGARPGGVFGNPAYSGPYLLFHFFWSLFAFGPVARALRRNTMLSAAALALLLMGLSLLALAVLAGQTRGVILGFAAGLGTMAILATFSKPAPKSVRLGAALALMILAISAGVVWKYRDAETMRRAPLLSRLTRLSPAESGSTRTRLLAWRGAMQAFADRPFLGWGPRNVYYAMNAHYDPRHVQFTADFRGRSESWYDKSHNSYLDLLVEGGLVGAAAFLALIAVIVRSLWQMPDGWLALCLSGGLAAYAVSNLVAFDTFGSLFGLFLTLAAVGVHEKPLQWPFWPRARAGNKPKPKERRAAARANRPSLKLAAAGAMLLVFLGMYANIQIAQAAHGYYLARNAFEQDPGAGITYYEEAFKHFSPYHADEKIKCAYLIINAAITNRPSSRSFDAGSLVLKLTGEALRSHPNDAQFYLLLNDMYNGLAMYGDRRLANDAERFGKKALELSPGRQEVMFTLGRTYIIKGEAAKAVEINRRMVQEYPDFALGHWFLGLSYLSNSQHDEARSEIRNALQKGYRFQNEEEAKTVKPLFDAKEFASFVK